MSTCEGCIEAMEHRAKYPGPETCLLCNRNESHADNYQEKKESVFMKWRSNNSSCKSLAKSWNGAIDAVLKLTANTDVYHLAHMIGKLKEEKHA